jgi:hypothetical protein
MVSPDNSDIRAHACQLFEHIDRILVEEICHEFCGRHHHCRTDTIIEPFDHSIDNSENELNNREQKSIVGSPNQITQIDRREGDQFCRFI